MKEENKKVIQAAVKEAGLHLEGKLPDHPPLPKRNPYAHLWERVKHTMGKSYKLCGDEDVQKILETIAWYRENIC